MIWSYSFRTGVWCLIIVLVRAENELKELPLGGQESTNPRVPLTGNFPSRGVAPPPGNFPPGVVAPQQGDDFSSNGRQSKKGVRLLDDPECSEDFKTLCGKDALNNFSILECVQNKGVCYFYNNFLTEVVFVQYIL